MTLFLHIIEQSYYLICIIYSEKHLTTLLKTESYFLFQIETLQYQKITH